MSITTSTNSITLKLETTPPKQRPLGFPEDVCQAVITAYEHVTEDEDYVVAVPTIRRVFAAFADTMGCVIALRMAESDAECHDFKGREDFEGAWQDELEDFFSVFNQVNPEWFIASVLGQEDLCFVDTDIECFSENCQHSFSFDEPCIIECVISNSPQVNLWPFGGGNTVSRSYLENPLVHPKSQSISQKYTDHRFEGKCEDCIVSAECNDIYPYENTDAAYEEYVRVYKECGGK